ERVVVIGFVGVDAVVALAYFRTSVQQNDLPFRRISNIDTAPAVRFASPAWHMREFVEMLTQLAWMHDVDARGAAPLHSFTKGLRTDSAGHESNTAATSFATGSSSSGSDGRNAARSAITVFSTASKRLCHKCHRSATWIASGTAVRTASA